MNNKTGKIAIEGRTVGLTPEEVGAMRRFTREEELHILENLERDRINEELYRLNNKGEIK